MSDQICGSLVVRALVMQEEFKQFLVAVFEHYNLQKLQN